MTKKTNDAKTRALRKRNCLNPKPDTVRDTRFGTQAFFDPRDLVQVRYEMLRRVLKDGHTISRAAADFGVSRPTWYQARQAFRKGGLPALVPGQPGPRGAHKLKQEIVEAVLKEQNDHPELKIRDLVAFVDRRFGITVHPRSLQRALVHQKKLR